MRYWGRTSTADRGPGMVGGHPSHGVGDELDVLAQAVIVEVPDDGSQLGMAGIAGQQRGMDETVPTRGRLGTQPVRRQRGHDLTRHAQGVDELAVGLTGMDVDAAHVNPDLNRREALVLDLAQIRAVQRVGEGGAKRLDVEPRRAHPDLLVGRESHAQGRPWQLRVGGQVRDRGDDLGHAGLVVGAEQRVAAGGDDVVTALVRQLGHRLRVQSRAGPRELDDPAVVAVVHDRLDAGTRGVGGCVHVGDQAHHRVRRGRCWPGRWRSHSRCRPAPRR